MFDIIYHIGNSNWVFGDIFCYRNKWRVHFTKNIHSNIIVNEYDPIFNALELIYTDTKDELLDFCNQQIYIIQNKEP